MSNVAIAHQQDIDFAAMLCSRVCHDMANSILALSAGLEFLEDSSDTDMQEEATGLLKSSTEKITARLQYARLAYGASGSSGSELDLRQVSEVLDNIAKFEKPDFAFDIPMEFIDKNKAKLLLNMANISLGCLPRGGTIHVKLIANPFRLAIVANGAMVRVQDGTLDVLNGHAESSESNVYNIQAAYVRKLVETIDGDLTVDITDNDFTMTVSSD